MLKELRKLKDITYAAVNSLSRQGNMLQKVICL